MKLSVEILEHIFSFLVLQRETLAACSKDPLLSQIAEKPFYHHVIICDGGNGQTSDPNSAFEPGRFSKLVSENPHIPYYVRILEIHQDHRQGATKDLDEFAKTLLTFPVLECIMLTTPRGHDWHWSQPFRTALEDCLNLSTVKTIHLVGGHDFEFSVLENCQNIENLSLSGGLWPNGQFCHSALPRLKSLTLSTEAISSSVLDWVKLHIDELLSFRCVLSTGQVLLQLLETLPDTLKRLEIDITKSIYGSSYGLFEGDSDTNPLPEFSPVPPNLQQLIIRTAVTRTSTYYLTRLTAAADAIKLFISSPQHLILDIDVFLRHRHLSAIDFSPLAVLGAASHMTPRIDLYIHTGTLQAGVTRAQLLASLAPYGDVMSSIEKGILVIHPEETAPDIDTPI